LFSGVVHFQISIDDGLIHYSDGLQFGLNPIIAAGSNFAGRTYWDSTWQTVAIDLNNNDVTGQVFQENHAYCINDQGGNLVAGDVVYIKSASGGFSTIAKAQANAEATSFALGVVTMALIANGDKGNVTVFGNVSGLNTDAWVVGTSLYLSDSVAGALTSTAPSENNFDVRIARVIKQSSGGNDGRIFVNIRQMSKLTDLGDVTITNPAVDEVLGYNGTEWTNRPPVVGGAGPGIEFYHTSPQLIALSTENTFSVKTLSKTPVTSTSATVTMTSANPGIFTLVNHGFINGTNVVFTTTGALPTNIVPGTTYFVIATGLTANAFQVAATLNGTAINTTAGVQSGTHTVTVGEMIVAGIGGAASTANPIVAWLYDTALARTQLDAGIWQFNNWVGMGSTTSTNLFTENVYKVLDEAGTITVSTDSTTIRRATASTGTPFAVTKINYGGTALTDSYLRTPKGLYRILTWVSDTVITFSTPTGYSNESTVAFGVWKSVIAGTQSADINTTTPTYTGLVSDIAHAAVTSALDGWTVADKLGVISFAICDPTRTLTMTYNGTTRNSHVSTPLITLHNNLAGLDGGGGGVYNHLTALEYAGSGSGVFAKVTSPVFTTPNIGAATGSVTGNAGTATKLAATKTINGVAFDGSGNITVPSDITPGTSGNVLTSNGSLWTSAAIPNSHVAATVSTTNGLSISGQEISLQLASTNTHGALSDTDWNTFNGKQAALTFGIADTNKVQIDAADVADNDYAKFTATGLEGRSYAEVLSDIGAAPLASPTFTGTVTIPALTLPSNGQVLLTVPTSDGHATGNITNAFNSGYSSSAVGDLVYLDVNSTWQKCDMGTSVATYSGLLGIALEVKAAANALKVALPGSFVYATAFPPLTIGSPVYMSDAGAIVVAQPSTADHAIRMIGWAVHSDKIFFFPSPDYLIHV
jgi:hypothetical protein